MVVGADGFLGAVLAAALGATGVVWRAPGSGEVHIGSAAPTLAAARVVVNASGFAVRAGLAASDYEASHEGTTRAVIDLMRPGATLLQISSASVLGASRALRLGYARPPDPASFPVPAYAAAKLRAERAGVAHASARGVSAITLRPAVVYAASGRGGMVGTLCRAARAGVLVHLVPGSARQHLCSSELLVAAVRAALALPPEQLREPLVVADPFHLTSRELAGQIGALARAAGLRALPLPVPARAIARVLGRFPHAHDARLDLATWGGIAGVLALDTLFDESRAFDALGLDRAAFGAAETLAPTLQALVSGSPAR